MNTYGTAKFEVSVIFSTTYIRETVGGNSGPFVQVISGYPTTPGPHIPKIPRFGVFSHEIPQYPFSSLFSC